MQTINKIHFALEQYDQILIEHNQFNQAIAAMNRCFRMAQLRVESTCVAIVGPSGAGKSRAQEHFESLHPRIVHDEFTEIPVVRVKVNAKPTIKALAGKILLSMGDPLFNKGTENELTERLQVLIRETRTRVLMLDEFQHFSDQAGKHIQHHVADWLKVLVEQTRIGLVIAGLERTLSIIQSNDQLERRFNTPIVLKPFDWARKQERLEFLSFLGEMQSRMEPLVLPELTSNEMGFRFYRATRGLIGNIVSLLTCTAINASDRADPVIHLEHLAEAYRETIWGQYKHEEEPFTSELPIGSKNVEITSNQKATV